MDALEKMIQEMKSQKCGKNLAEKSMDSNFCPLCKGTGFELYYNKDKHCVARECKCGLYKRKIFNNTLKFANLPEAFKNVRICNFEKKLYKLPESWNKVETALKCVKYWLDEFDTLKDRGMGLYLYSKTKGSGKTMMAAGIANELMDKKDCQVKFCTSLQILNEIKASWDNQNGETENNLLHHLSNSEILIIDDFGTEQSDKPWINERFYQIINNRYVDKKVTIFTSNERLDLLKYDDRITNRIKERTFQIPFPEESVRDIIAKNNMRELINGIKKEKKNEQKNIY